MTKIFDTHLHYSLENTLEETIRLFKREFEILKVDRMAFLSLPHHAHCIGDKGIIEFSHLQNVKGLYLKKVFSPKAYAFAGLEHPMTEMEDEQRSKLYLKQAEEYLANGYDGIKMLEGYPSMRKVMGRSLCDNVYDRFYSFLEANNVVVTMHVANPVENWDITKVNAYALKMGRYCDETYPTKEQLHKEVEGIMEKYPNLHLVLAHFGFLTYDINQARAFLDKYPNTMLDITPGGEQYFNMLEDWDKWHKFFVDYQDRIIYGSDLYANPYTTEEEWQKAISRRPKLISDFFETDTEHEYAGTHFCGVKLEEEIIAKIYCKNALRILGEPKPINKQYLLQKCLDFLQIENDAELRKDLELMISDLLK